MVSDGASCGDAVGKILIGKRLAARMMAEGVLANEVASVSGSILADILVWTWPTSRAKCSLSTVLRRSFMVVGINRRRSIEGSCSRDAAESLEVCDRAGSTIRLLVE